MRDRASRLALLLALFCCLPGMTARRANQPSLIGVQIFPADNPWNWDISGHNVHPKTLYFVNSVGSVASLMPSLPKRHILCLAATLADSFIL